MNGSRSEGSFSVFATLIPKFVAIPASALPLAVINILGFEPPISGVSQPQDEEVKTFIRLTFVLLPLLSATIGTYFKLKFPIKTKNILTQIQEGIAIHQRLEKVIECYKPNAIHYLLQVSHAGLSGLECGMLSRDPTASYEDPITNRQVKLLELSEEESKIVWMYENFSCKCLRYLVEKRTAQPVVVEMGIYFGTGTVLTVMCLTGTIMTFPFIKNRKLAILPVALVCCSSPQMTLPGRECKSTVALSQIVNKFYSKYI